MKQILLLFTLISLVSFTGCYKDNDSTPETGNTMNDLVVPVDFDWKTTQTIDLIITLPAEGELQPLLITNRDGSEQYFKGYPDNESRILTTKITIPSYLIELRLVYNGAIGPNIVYINSSTVTYNFNMSTKSANVSNCDLSGFTTYSKGGWGSKAAGNNVGTLRDAHFDQVYPTNFVVGNTNGYTITFNTTQNVEDYLPGGGGAKILTKSWINPVSKNKLGNMADQIIAARLNRDYNQSGYLGVNPDFTLGELVFIDGSFADITVNDFLEMAETALSGGSMNGFSAEEFKNGAESIINSFHEGTNNGILTCPPDITQDDPYIEVSSTCSNSDVIFTIINTGDGTMTSAFNYKVYKNNIEIQTGTYQLDVNNTLDITASGLDTDIFMITVETPRGTTLENSLTNCGNGGIITNQLSGTLAYEDLWPGKGDYDFNDLVVDYDFEITKNDQEVVQNINATFTIKAYGASLHNGFAFTLPTVDPQDIESVTGYNIAAGSIFNLDSKGLEMGQSKATIIVFDDVRRIMPQTSGGIGVNTQEQYPFVDEVAIDIDINFIDGAITFNQLNIGNFNPFIIVNSVIDGSPGIRGLEVHLPNYEPSDLMDFSYFDTQDDNSQPISGKYFITENNLPWAINIPDDFDWVTEFNDITGAYLMFGEWAESNGINYPDWYKDESGYRNESLIYTIPGGN